MLFNFGLLKSSSVLRSSKVPLRVDNCGRSGFVRLQTGQSGIERRIHSWKRRTVDFGIVGPGRMCRLLPRVHEEKLPESQGKYDAELKPDRTCCASQPKRL